MPPKQAKHTLTPPCGRPPSFVCRCWWRKTNVWKWSFPEPRWRWLRLRWRRTRCCTAWRTSKSTPARPGSLPSRPACQSFSNHWSAVIRTEGRGSATLLKATSTSEGKRRISWLNLLPLCAYLLGEPPCDFRLQSNSFIKQCRVCQDSKTHLFTRPSSVLRSPLWTVAACCIWRQLEREKWH